MELDQIPATERIKPVFYATDADALTNLYDLTEIIRLCPKAITMDVRF